jgi:rSAM/selenodomain-associated transferase 2
MLSFSVIIPTLNEEQTIGHSIHAVRSHQTPVQLIIVDGGSTDQTRQIAQAAGAKVFLAPRGRGSQCNAGAQQATGSILVFLHADTLLPAGVFALLRAYFSSAEIQAGAFRIQFTPGNWFLNGCARFSRFDSILTTFGDQGLVVRRSFFAALGGFPEWPLFEDVHFLQKARQQTRIVKFPRPVVSSDRRFQEGGTVRQLLRNGWLLLRYLNGVSPWQLADQYERTRPEIS